MKQGDLVEILSYRAQVRYEVVDISGSYGYITEGPDMFGFIQRCYVFVPKYNQSWWIDTVDLELADNEIN